MKTKCERPSVKAAADIITYLLKIRTRTQQSVQTLVSFYLLNKVLRCIGVILLVEFSKYPESFSMIWSGITYIWHKQFGLLFIESPCSSYSIFTLLRPLLFIPILRRRPTCSRRSYLASLTVEALRHLPGQRIVWIRLHQFFRIQFSRTERSRRRRVE